jgi:hypothetical protein
MISLVRQLVVLGSLFFNHDASGSRDENKKVRVTLSGGVCLEWRFATEYDGRTRGADRNATRRPLTTGYLGIYRFQVTSIATNTPPSVKEDMYLQDKYVRVMRCPAFCSSSTLLLRPVFPERTNVSIPSLNS